MVVVDEAHRIKNAEGVWGSSAIEIAKEAKVKATAEADELIQNKVSDNRASPAFQQAPSLEIRGGTGNED